MSCITVEELLKSARERLGNVQVAEQYGLSNKIKSACVHRCKVKNNNCKKPISGLPLIFSKADVTNLENFSYSERKKIYSHIAAADPPFIILSRVPFDTEFTDIMARLHKIPVLFSEFDEYLLESRLIGFLKEKIEKTFTMHGALVNVNNVGVMITGESGTGKTSCAIALVREGHSWVADDAIRIIKGQNGILRGRCHEKVKNCVALKNFGMVSAEDLFGKQSVSEETVIDMMVRLERSKSKDEAPGEDQMNEECRILDVTLPCFSSSAGSDWTVHVRNIERATQQFLRGGYPI